MSAIPNHMHLSEWLTPANEADSSDEFKRYSVDKVNTPAYEILRRKENGRIEWPNFLLAIHMAYAWMPTMLWKIGSKLLDNKFLEKSKNERLDALNRVLRDAKKTNPNKNDIQLLRELTNNSVVGLSKVLHIFDPKHFPIWDSRVARTFFKQTQVNLHVGAKVDWYIKWIEVSREWASNPRVKEKIRKLKKKHKCLKGLRDLRIVELVVFCR